MENRDANFSRCKRNKQQYVIFYTTNVSDARFTYKQVVTVLIKLLKNDKIFGTKLNTFI